MVQTQTWQLRTEECHVSLWILITSSHFVDALEFWTRVASCTWMMTLKKVILIMSDCNQPEREKKTADSRARTFTGVKKTQKIKVKSKSLSSVQCLQHIRHKLYTCQRSMKVNSSTVTGHCIVHKSFIVVIRGIAGGVWCCRWVWVNDNERFIYRIRNIMTIRVVLSLTVFNESLVLLRYIAITDTVATKTLSTSLPSGGAICFLPAQTKNICWTNNTFGLLNKNTTSVQLESYLLVCQICLSHTVSCLKSVSGNNKCKT